MAGAVGSVVSCWYWLRVEFDSFSRYDGLYSVLRMMCFKAETWSLVNSWIQLRNIGVGNFNMVIMWISINGYLTQFRVNIPLESWKCYRELWEYMHSIYIRKMWKILDKTPNVKCVYNALSGKSETGRKPCVKKRRANKSLLTFSWPLSIFFS